MVESQGTRVRSQHSPTKGAVVVEQSDIGVVRTCFWDPLVGAECAIVLWDNRGVRIEPVECLQVAEQDSLTVSFLRDVLLSRK